MRSVLERMARTGRQPLHELPPSLARLAYEAGADVLELPRAPLARVEDFHITARDGQPLPARLYAAQTTALPALLYLHGGGFTVGSIATHDVLCRELSRRSGCMVVSLDYRLAPAHRFPVAVHDAWDALQWLAARATDIGAQPGRLAVGGDSAGGTLAAVCALMARDAGLPLALQMLFYPGTSARQDTASHRQFGQGLLLDHQLIAYFFDHYIDRHQRGDWRFSPLEAPHFEGVAPAWIGLAECDPVVDEGLLYADRLRMAGVPVDIEVYRGVTHEFIKLGRAIPQARLAHGHAAAALAKALTQ